MKPKKIILGITGSIAAYKIATLTRLLIKSGAEVQCLMTESATQFITPLTLSTLSKRPVLTEIMSENGWNNHVELGLWADAMLIAPCTATTMAKLANGLCDNIVTAVYLSARCPIFFAPAMDLDMWKHPATQQNVLKLQSYNNHLIPVERGELASGLVGDGRMAEPETIFNHLETFFKQKSDFNGQKILITAGPTYEAIDPVRFIGNRSSGKMGVALAETLAKRGATVILILGPSALSTQVVGIQTIRVESAQQMYEAAIQHFPNCDAAILAAAVADYRPQTVATEKIKKKSDTLTIELERTADIAAELGRRKTAKQRIIGFALETHEELANALSKLRRKNMDAIVLNSLRDAGAGFQHDTNKITIVLDENNIKKFDLKDKKSVASDIVDTLKVLLLMPNSII
jgi:phosphopantothenoylcysteine decarboxylase / phosphopantothenate---cysteine ligase